MHRIATAAAVGAAALLGGFATPASADGGQVAGSFIQKSMEDHYEVLPVSVPLTGILTKANLNKATTEK